MIWEGRFALPVPPERALADFADPVRMAPLVPGVEVEGTEPDGRLNGRITVAFGPRRLVLKGHARASVDPAAMSGVIEGQGAADARAARFRVRLAWRLVQDPDAPDGSVVVLRSEADLQGVLAEVARTGGPVVAGALMEAFAARLRQHFTDPAPAAPQGGDNALGAMALARGVARQGMARLRDRIGGTTRQDAPDGRGEG